MRFKLPDLRVQIQRKPLNNQHGWHLIAHIDYPTEKGDHISYARYCAEISAEKSSLKIKTELTKGDMVEQEVVYIWVPLLQMLLILDTLRADGLLFPLIFLEISPWRPQWAKAGSSKRVCISIEEVPGGCQIVRQAIVTIVLLLGKLGQRMCMGLILLLRKKEIWGTRRWYPPGKPPLLGFRDC